MSSAFEPPEHADDEPSALPGVLLAWMVAGTVLGCAVGLTFQLTEIPGALPGALGTLFGTTGLGALAWSLERRWSCARPAILDARGRLQKPPHALLYALPIALSVPGLLTLVVVSTVAMDSALPALVFGIGGFGLGWACRRLLSTHRLTEALQALEEGDAARGRALLESLEGGWLSTRRGRTTARLNLGMLALGEGDLARAGRWYGRADAPEGRVFAQAGLALVRLLEDRLDEAEAVLMEALACPGSETVQGQLDLVRLLLVFRQDGAEAARRLGRSLEGPEAGELFIGVLAAAHLLCGDLDGARSRVDARQRSILEQSGWARLVPEIDALLTHPAL